MLELGDFVNYYGYSEPFGCRPAVVWEIFSRGNPQGENGSLTVLLRNVDDHNDTVRVKNAHSCLYLFKVVGSRDKSGNPLRIGDAVVFPERGRSQQGVIRGLDSNGFFIVETLNRNLRVETGRNLRKAGPLPVDRDGTPLYVGDSVTFFTGQNPEIGEVGKIISIDSPGEMKIQTASGTYVGSLSGSIQKIKQEQSSGTKREEPHFNLGDLVTIRKEVPYCDPTQTFIIQGVFRDSYKIQSVSRHGFSVTLSGVKANELCEVVPTPKFPHQTVLKRIQPGTVFYFFTRDRDGTYTPDKRFRYLLLESAATNKSRYVLQPPHLTNHVLIYDLTRKSLHFRDMNSKVYVEEPSL